MENQQEEWRPIPSFPGYEASDQGKIRSLLGDKNKILTGTALRGYRVVNITRAGCKYRRFVHRLILDAFVGECPDGYQCRHLNGNRSDNRLVNIAWGSQSENEADKTRHGTAVKGSRAKNAKLTEDDVRTIRAIGRSMPQQQIAARYGVKRPVISRILNRISWIHVQ